MLLSFSFPFYSINVKMLNDCIKIQSIWVISRHRLSVIAYRTSSIRPQFSALIHQTSVIFHLEPLTINAFRHQPSSLSPQFSAIRHLCFSCRNAGILLYAKITFYSLFSLCFNAFIMSLDEETISFNIASSRSLFLPLTSYI